MPEKHVTVTHVVLRPASGDVTEAEAFAASAGYALANEADALLVQEGRALLFRHADLRATVQEVDASFVDAITSA